MKAVLGLLGAIIGVALALVFLANYAARIFAQISPAESPDDVSQAHSLAWLATIFLTGLVGWFFGRGIGALVSRGKD